MLWGEKGGTERRRFCVAVVVVVVVSAWAGSSHKRAERDERRGPRTKAESNAHHVESREAEEQRTRKHQAPDGIEDEGGKGARRRIPVAVRILHHNTDGLQLWSPLSRASAAAWQHLRRTALASQFLVRDCRC